jgi:hypothetical protein
MLTKLLLTSLIILFGFLYITRASRSDVVSTQVQSTSPSESEFQVLFRQGAYLLVILMVLTSAGIVVLKIQKQNQTVTVHVINTQTGQRLSYQAKRNKIGHQKFTTIEGKSIHIAAIERLEVP